MSYWNEKEYWGEACTRNCIWLFQIREGNIKGEPYFRTECVFGTKQEALDWGNSRTYEWGGKDRGWRVFGVPVYGIMAKCLSESKEFMQVKIESKEDKR